MFNKKETTSQRSKDYAKSEIPGIQLLCNSLDMNSEEAQIYLESIINEELNSFFKEGRYDSVDVFKKIWLDEFYVNIKELMFKGIVIKIIMDDGKIYEKKIHFWLHGMNYQSKQQIYEILHEWLEGFNAINNRGFAIKTSFDELSYVKELAGLLIDEKYLKRTDLLPLYYKNVLNFFLINLVPFLEEHIDGIDDINVKSDTTQLQKRIMTSLDPYIRKKMMKRGITVIQNVYSGFDCEYEPVDFKTNKLLSSQIAATTRSIIKIPNINYQISNIEIPKDINKIFNVAMYINSVNYNISMYRKKKFLKFDKSLKLLLDGLTNLTYFSSIKYKKTKGDHYFMFPVKPIETSIYIGNKFSSTNLINGIDDLIKGKTVLDYNTILDVLKDIYKESNNHKYIQLKLELEDSSVFNQVGKNHIINEPSSREDTEKFLSRSKMCSFSDDFINVSRIQNYYLIAHLTSADLSLLEDFDKIKHELDIVGSNFVTIGKPININNKRVFLRDTMLLAPSGNRSLESLGRLYDTPKIDLKNYDKSKMSILLAKDRDLFIEYAVRDSVITLMHACYIEDFRFEKAGRIGVPLTLSSLGTEYVTSKWEEMGYLGYNKNEILQDITKLMTPKGISGNLNVGSSYPFYLAAYKGGRNESYMYGVDTKIQWYDYDLVSAYTTVMAAVGEPDYLKTKELNTHELSNMSNDDLVNSFTVISGDFSFPKNVKFPSIPVKADNDITIYPLKGKCVITGIEYVLAKKQGCYFKNLKIFHTPFGEIKPFNVIIKEVQDMRRRYPKGSILNMLYKEMGNSLYGNTVRGISNKKKYDIKTGQMLRIEGGKLSNPLIAGWITAYIRSIIGETLHSIQGLDGKVVSCTTDGFITNIENLEGRLLLQNDSDSLLSKYKCLRRELSNDPLCFELKHEGKGIITWSTRGQFSLDARLAATTGFQRGGYTVDYLDHLFKGILSKSDKSFHFVQSRLRSSLDIYKKGGHVTKTFSDRIFRLVYDNKRVICLPEEMRNNIDYSNLLMDSRPGTDVEEILYLRNIGKLGVKNTYDKRLSSPPSKKYKDFSDIIIRNFLRVLLGGELESDGVVFDNYNSIVDFIQGYKKGVRISKSSLSHLKNSKVILKSLPYTKETPSFVDFVDYVKARFPKFDSNKLIK